VTLLNTVVVSNVHERLHESEHVTFSLLRYHDDGRIVHAGAHEDMLVYRKRERSCEIVRTRGLWLGALPSIDQATEDAELRLEVGDVLVLYTDGITESLSAEREMYGVERLAAKLCALGEQPAAAICEGLFADVLAYSSKQDDDRTLVVLRRMGA
jgi:serine phosphatase RsbU (regulator of sigma subunit)